MATRSRAVPGQRKYPGAPTHFLESLQIDNIDLIKRVSGTYNERCIEIEEAFTKDTCPSIIPKYL